MAPAGAAPRIPWLFGALVLLLAVLLHSASLAAPEKKVPNRYLRVRTPSSLHRSSVRWRLPHSSGLRSPHRYPGYRSGYGESNRKMSYIPLPKERSDEMKKLASESVYLVSLPSRTSQALSQPAYRAALSKRKVEEEEEPEEAKDITVRVMSSQSVLVTWSDSISEKQRTAPSREYTVRYREKGESARWDYKQVSNKRVLVDKLIPDTMYEFAVRISQGEKEGKWSASVYQRTPEAAPTSAPENLDVLPIKGKATSVAATWDALPESEGRVKEYILSYAPALKPFGAKSITYPGETTSAIVDGLEPGERYIFKIRAGNRRGQGPQSKAFSVVLPTTSIPESKSSQLTRTEDALEMKPSGNAESFLPFQTSSALSDNISKHTSGHSSSVPHGRDSESPLSNFKNKLLSGGGIIPKTQLSSRRRMESEIDTHSNEGTSEHDSSSRTSIQSKTQDIRSSVRPHSSVKPSHSVLSSSRTALRSRTPARNGQISTDKQRLLPSSSSTHTLVSLSASSSSPKDTESKTKNTRHDSSNHHSSPETSLDNLPADNESNDQFDSMDKTSVTASKTPGDTHLILSSSRQPSASRKVIHPTKLLTPSVLLKSSSSSASISSQKHSRYPPNKLVPSDTSDTPDTYESREKEEREQKPSSRPSSPQDGSSAAVQRNPLSHFNRHTLRDSRVATSAVSAAATHVLPHSHGSTSAKNKPNGRDDSDDNNSENSEKEDEENRQRSPSRSSSRSSSGQSVSERFNLFKYRSALTANRFANKGGNTQDARTQPSEAPSSTSSSKVQPQSSSQLSSSSFHKFNSSTDKHKELEGEEEHPLPSTPHHGYSSSFSRQSSVDYSRRRSSLAESRNPHIIAPTDKSNPTNVKEESFDKERKNTETKIHPSRKDSLSSVSGKSPLLSKINHRSSSSTSQKLANVQSSRSRGVTSSTDSLSRTSMEKSTPLQTQASVYQPDDLETKDVSSKLIQTPLLSKKTLMGSSHALSRKTLHPEVSRHQKAVTDQSQQQPSLNSRSHLTMTSYQNKEKVDDEEGESLDENYYKGAHDKEEQRASPSASIKDVSSSRRISTSLSQGNTDSFLLRHSDSHTSKSNERSPNRRESLTSSRVLSSSPRKPVGSQVITTNEDTSDAYVLPVTSRQSKNIQPGSTSVSAVAKDHQYSRGTSLSSRASSANLRQTHSSAPHSQTGSRTASQTDKKYGLFQPTPTEVELYDKTANSNMHQSLSNNNDNYDDYDQLETEENPTSSSVSRWPSSSSSRDSKHVKNNVAGDKNKSPNPVLTHKARFPDEEEYKQEQEVEEEEHPTSKTSNAAPLGRLTPLTSKSSQTPNKSNTLPKVNLALPHSSGSSVPSQRHPTHSVSPTHSSSSSSLSTSQRKQQSRLLNPSLRQQARVPHRQGNGGRPNLTTKLDLNNKITPGGNGKRNGQRIINGPQGTKWIVDLDRGLVLNVEGRYLQDSRGNPLRVKLGGDGRTIVDSKGAPVVSPDGLPLFGHGRFSKPVANAQDKPIVSLGGKPLIGLEMVKKTTTPSTTRTTTTTTTTTITTTTTPEPTTTEPPTEKPVPTCPPGSYAEYDEDGNLVLDLNGLPECNSEDIFSGHDADVMATTESYVVYDEDYEFFETTLPPSTTTITGALPEIGFPEFSNTGSDPLSEYDVAGKKRFSAPYVTYLSKDPAAPCSLTEALDHFQVESLDEIIPAGLKDIDMRPQKVPYNITIVAVEGCHSFVIVDWAKPTRGDLVTGYLVYSASYDDFLRNKWSTKTAGNTHLPIENLKPNTRYYFKVQAKNLYGYGPISSSVSFVTESDNPLLIVRPPGGEPIWIPFTFKYDPTYSECSGKQYVKRTWYRKFVGVVLCNSLRYKIYLSDDLRDTFYSIGDSWGRGEDHCQFVDSHLDGRTGPQSYVEALPTIQGYYRQYRQEPVSFGRIGYMTPYYYVGWYECGVPIPGKW